MTIKPISKTRNDGLRLKVLPNMISLLALVAIGFIPYLNKEMPHSIRLGIFLLYVMTIPLVGKVKSKKGSADYNILKWWAIFMCLQLLYSLIGYSRELTYFLARFHIYVIPIAMVYVIRCYSSKEIKLLWLTSLALLSLGLGISIILGGQSGEDFYRNTDDMNPNAGTTAFVCACLFVMPALFLVFIKNHMFIYKLACLLGMIAITYYMIFLNMRATSLVILAFMMVLFILLNFNRLRIKKRKLFAIVGIVAIFLYLFALPLLEIVSSVFSGSIRMTARIGDLETLLTSGSVYSLSEGSLYSRIILWQTSIETFLSSFPHFLFGVGEKYHVVWDIMDRIRAGVGDHSEFFDLAAQYGIIGVVINYMMYKYTFSFIYHLTNDDRMKNMLEVVFIAVVFYGFVNNITNNVAHMSSIFLFFPITIELLERKKI